LLDGFECGQSVVVRDYRGNNKWTSGTIEQKTGPMSYRVETEAGSEWRRHADQILDSITDTKTSDDNIIEPNKVSTEARGFVCPLHSVFRLTHNLPFS
jgi:hypothetical protein